MIYISNDNIYFPVNLENLINTFYIYNMSDFPICFRLRTSVANVFKIFPTKGILKAHSKIQISVSLYPFFFQTINDDSININHTIKIIVGKIEMVNSISDLDSSKLWKAYDHFKKEIANGKSISTENPNIRSILKEFIINCYYPKELPSSYVSRTITNSDCEDEGIKTLLFNKNKSDTKLKIKNDVKNKKRVNIVELNQAYIKDTNKRQVYDPTVSNKSILATSVVQHKEIITKKLWIFFCTLMKYPISFQCSLLCIIISFLVGSLIYN